MLNDTDPYVEWHRSIWWVTQIDMLSDTDRYVEWHRSICWVTQIDMLSDTDPYVERHRSICWVTQIHMLNDTDPYVEWHRSICWMTQTNMLNDTDQYVEWYRSICWMTQIEMLNRYVSTYLRGSLTLNEQLLVISIVIDSDRGHCYEHLKKKYDEPLTCIWIFVCGINFWAARNGKTWSVGLFRPNLRELGLFHPYFVCKCSFRDISRLLFIKTEIRQVYDQF